MRGRFSTEMSHLRRCVVFQSQRDCVIQPSGCRVGEATLGQRSSDSPTTLKELHPTARPMSSTSRRMGATDAWNSFRVHAVPRVSPG